MDVALRRNRHEVCPSAAGFAKIWRTSHTRRFLFERHYSVVVLVDGRAKCSRVADKNVSKVGGAKGESAWRKRGLFVTAIILWFQFSSCRPAGKCSLQVFVIGQGAASYDHASTRHESAHHHASTQGSHATEGSESAWPSAVQIFAANERMNQMLLEHLDPAAWRVEAAGQGAQHCGDLHPRAQRPHKWVRLTAPHLKVPPQLNRANCTPQQARAGLAESAARCAEMLAEALARTGPHRDVSQRWLGSAVAGWRGDAVLHDFSRSSSSRAGVYARASARIPVADGGDVRDVELGEALEGMRMPGADFLRARDWYFHRRACH